MRSVLPENCNLGETTGCIEIRCLASVMRSTQGWFDVGSEIAALIADDVVRT